MLPLHETRFLVFDLQPRCGRSLKARLVRDEICHFDGLKSNGVSCRSQLDWHEHVSAYPSGKDGKRVR